MATCLMVIIQNDNEYAIRKIYGLNVGAVVYQYKYYCSNAPQNKSIPIPSHNGAVWKFIDDGTDWPVKDFG